MRNKLIIRCAAVCMAVLMTVLLAFTPVSVSAATLLKRGSKGDEVMAIQTTLKELGYYTYSRTTGYYGSITEKAVKHFQKDNGIAADGILGKRTMALLKEQDKNSPGKATVTVTNASKLAVTKTMRTEAITTSALADLEATDSEATDLEATQTGVAETEATGTVVTGSAVTGSAIEAEAVIDSDLSGALDWFKEVKYIWDRGENAVVTDVETGLSFTVKRTYGTNHADVEPLTKADTAIIKEIWDGFSWERRAVIVQINKYTLAASMTSMPHAGVDSKPNGQYVSNRSVGYGRGINLDQVKNNGASGVMDIHFKNSRTHTTNRTQKSQQDMVKKAANFIAELS